MKTNKISKLSPCRDAMKWMRTQKSPAEAWNNCERGDWMLWIAKRLEIDDRKLTMAKYHCAAQVLHLMKDQRSINAMAAALQYANGEISREDLNAAADAAHADYAYAAYAAADADARTRSLKRSADICRQYITDEVLTAYNKLR